MFLFNLHFSMIIQLNIRSFRFFKRVTGLTYSPLQICVALSSKQYSYYDGVISCNGTYSYGSSTTLLTKPRNMYYWPLYLAWPGTERHRGYRFQEYFALLKKTGSFFPPRAGSLTQGNSWEVICNWLAHLQPESVVLHVKNRSGKGRTVLQYCTCRTRRFGSIPVWYWYLGRVCARGGGLGENWMDGIELMEWKFKSNQHFVLS